MTKSRKKSLLSGTVKMTHLPPPVLAEDEDDDLELLEDLDDL